MEEKLNTYIDELAPWEKKKEHYRDIQLGQDVRTQKTDIKNQATKMITSQIASTNVTIASKNLVRTQLMSLPMTWKILAMVFSG